MKNIAKIEKEKINDDYKLHRSNAKCCFTCEYCGILPNQYYYCQKQHCYLTDEVETTVEYICDNYEQEKTPSI